MTAMTIEQLYQALVDGGYYDASAMTLVLPAENSIGATAIDALLGTVAIFPQSRIAMALADQPDSGSEIVFTGTLTDGFLGMDAGATARATFSVATVDASDPSGEPQLAVAVDAKPGNALGIAFPALDQQSAPATQKFASATFEAKSAATAPALSFIGEPDIDGMEVDNLWIGDPPAVAGTINISSDIPAFELASEFTATNAKAGLDPLDASLRFSSPGEAGPTGEIATRLSNADPSFASMVMSKSLPTARGVPLAFETAPGTDIAFEGLDTVAGLFLGQQLAAIIPSQFSLGTALHLTQLEIDIANGGDTFQTTQLAVLAGTPVANGPEALMQADTGKGFDILPGGLLTLMNIGASIIWSPSSDFDITFFGDFKLAKSDSLLFQAYFGLSEQRLGVELLSKGADVGALLKIFDPEMKPPKTGLTLDSIGGYVIIPNQNWGFHCEIGLGREGWSIPLMRGQEIGLDEVSLRIDQTSASRNFVFGANANLFGSEFDISAQYHGGWSFAGMLVKRPENELKLKDITSALLPFDIEPPDISIVSLAFSITPAGGEFYFATEVKWVIEALDTTLDAQVEVRRLNKEFSGFVGGEIDIHGLQLTARYEFSPTTKAISFGYRTLTITYTDTDTEQTLAIMLGKGTVADLFDFFLSFADPGGKTKMGGVWSAFEKIKLPAIVVTVNLTTKAITVQLDEVANLGFLDIKQIVVEYTRSYGSPSVKVGVVGTFLGQDYGDKDKLSWDALNDSPPAVPGAGTQAFDLEFLALGQRVAIGGKVPIEMDKAIDALEEAMRPPADPSKNPVAQGSALTYDASSNWLIGSRFTIASTLRMDIIFNDPVMYGVLIELSGEKAAIFKGLRFEILYRKVTDKIGVYHIELTLPDVMRHLEFGEVSITLPIVTLDIYTNGNFKVDFGFPTSLSDFSRSFSIQVFPFIGFGGFYFALLNGETSSNIPKVADGRFGTVVEFGFALQIGVGKTLTLGILSGGISITVGGQLQGVLGWYHPDDANLPTVQYYHLIGTVAVIGKVYATVDFGIVSASVSLTVYASITLDMESYKALLIEVSAGVSVSVSVKVLFVKINFKFKATITERFTIGSDSTPPWTLAPPDPQQPAQLRARRSYRPQPLLIRQPWHNHLRQRPPRRLVVPLVAGKRKVALDPISIAVTVSPMTSQALDSDFAFDGGPPMPTPAPAPQTAPTGAGPVLSLLLTLETSSDATAAPNRLLGAMLQDLIGAIGHEAGTVSAAVIDEILHELSSPDACDLYFTSQQLDTFFTDYAIGFEPAARAATGVDGEETPSAILSMIPDIAINTPDFSIDFAQDRRVSSDYENQIRDYFAKLTPNFANDGGMARKSRVMSDEANVESVATFLFRYQFYLLAKSIVEAARDELATMAFTVPEGSGGLTLSQVANRFANQYLAPVDTGFDTLASLFGLTAKQIADANPDLPSTGARAGETVFIPAQSASGDRAILYISQTDDTAESIAACFGIDAAALPAANPGVEFNPLAPGTQVTIPGVRIVHHSLAGETAGDIATEFAVTPEMLSAANPGISLDPLVVGTPVVIPRRVTALSIAAANQNAAGVLGAQTLALGDIEFFLPAAATPTAIAAEFGITISQLLADNNERSAIFASGRSIDLTGLETKTRSNDALDRLALYWCGSQSDDILQALDQANPGLLLVAGQKLAIPHDNAADTYYTTLSGQTFTDVMEANPGTGLGALIANNLPILLDPGQDVTLPTCTAVTSNSFDLHYTVNSGENYEDIARKFFAADRVADASALLRRINGGDQYPNGQVILIPYSTSPQNLVRQYGISIDTLAANPAIADPASTILAPGAGVKVTSASIEASAEDTLSGLAKSVDLSLEQLIDQIGRSTVLPENTQLTVPAIPGMAIDALTRRLAEEGKFTNALGLTSRFLLGGLRVPAPQFVPQSGIASAAVEATLPEERSTFPLYAIVGQEFPVDPAATTAYTITLTSSGAGWVKLPEGGLSFPLADAEVQQIAYYAANVFAPGIAAGAAQQLPQFSVVADSQPPSSVLWWQTPAPPLAPPSNAKAVQPSLWSIPAALGDRLAGSPRGKLAYAGVVGTVQPDGRIVSAPLSASRFVTVIDLKLEEAPGNLPGVYTIAGTDQADLQRLIAVWEHLQGVGASASISIAYQSQSATAGSGELVSQDLDLTETKIFKTNLSTEGRPPPMQDIGPDTAVKTTTTAAASVANFTPEQSRDALQFIWEASLVNSGGFYLRYIPLEGTPGLPGSLFSEGRQASVKLVIAGLDLPENVPMAMAFNNAMVVADNIDPAHDKLLFEALSWVAGPADSLASAAQAIAAKWPDLPDLPDGQALARVNQLIPGTLKPGTPYEGQTALPSDSMRSLALRAGKTVDELAAAIMETPCLQQGARFELMGEPVETVDEGMTLVRLSQEHSFLDPASLAALNTDTANLLAVGQTISIPGQPARPIAAGETFGSIAASAGVAVTLLGTVNANAAILAAGAQIVVAADSLRVLASLPPGNCGFALSTPAPDESSNDPAVILANRYHMLGFALGDTAAFAKSGYGLPATPAQENGEQSDGLWNYRQVMAIAPFAKAQPAALPAALGDLPFADPYAGIAAGAEVAMQLLLQDILGNWTDGSALPGNGTGPTLTANVGYCDEIVPLAAWSSLTNSYRVDAAGPLLIELNFAPNKFLPDAAALPMPTGRPDATKSTAVERAIYAQSEYAKALYQLLQSDVSCAVSSTFGPVADPAAVADNALTILRGTAAAIEVFLTAAKTQLLTLAGPAQGFTSLAALVKQQTDPAGAGFPVSWSDLANANSDALAASIFADPKIQLPVFKAFRSGETPTAFLTNAAIPDPAVFAAANAHVPLAQELAVVTPPRPVAADLMQGSLAQIADGMNCPLLDGGGDVKGLATAASTATLTKGTVLTFKGASFTAADTDTLSSAAAALGEKLDPPETLSVQDVAAANRYVDAIFAPQTLKVASAVTGEGATLAQLSDDYGGDPASVLADNGNTPGLWDAATMLLTGEETHNVGPQEKLRQIASDKSIEPGILLACNTQAALADNAQLVIPWSAKCPSPTAATHLVGTGQTLASIAAAFPGWSVAALAQDNANWRGIFAPVPISVGSTTVTPSANSSFASLAEALDTTIDALAEQLADDKTALRAGAIIFTPAMRTTAGETLASAAARYGADPIAFASANATLSGFLAPDQTFNACGTEVTVLANDTLAMILARLNAARLEVKLQPVSLRAVIEAASNVALLECDIIPCVSAPTITADLTASTETPITNLAVDLAITRDPQLVDPAFRSAPAVISANCPITAAPFAQGADKAESLSQFAADFEAAFPGFRLATGPQNMHFAPVLAKASLRATAGGGTGSSPGNSVRALWVVNFSPTGIEYSVKPDNARFFALEPLSTVAFSADDLEVPTYSAESGLGKDTHKNFRGADPESWNAELLKAIDLVLSPPYAAAAGTDTEIIGSLKKITASKAAIANGMMDLVNSLTKKDPVSGLVAACETMRQQMLIELASATRIQGMVQFDVTVKGEGVGTLTPAPRMAGTLQANVLATPDGSTPVDPAHPFAALAAAANVASAYVAQAVFAMPEIVAPNVSTALEDQAIVTSTGETLATLAAKYAAALGKEVTAAMLAAQLTLADDSAPLFASGVSINASPIIVPGTFDTVTGAAGWIPSTVEDMLQANAERTDFFVAGSTITIGELVATQGPDDTLENIAAIFGGISNLAAGLSGIDAQTETGAYSLNTAQPPHSLQRLPQFSFQSSKVALDGTSQLTGLLTLNRPSTQRQLVLDLAFKPTQLEFDIHGIAGVAGYEGSSWLSFISPLDEAPGEIGQIAIPIALRGYPEPATITDQQALKPTSGAADKTLTKWTYRFKAQRRFAAQDEMTMDVTFNDQEPLAKFYAMKQDRTPVIKRLARFAAVWPEVAKDLAKLPGLLEGQGSSDRGPAKNALAALSTLVGDVANAWNPNHFQAEVTETERQSFRYQLSTLNGPDGKVDALVLRRDKQEDSQTDDFQFLAPLADVPTKADPSIRQPLADLFAANGLALSKLATAKPDPTVAGDWIITDPGEGDIAPQTYVLKAPEENSQVVQVWRQFLWPVLRLDVPQADGPPLPTEPLHATQSGDLLTYHIPPEYELNEGAPLSLLFDFTQLDIFTLTNGWGGVSISRNANLLADIRETFVYETSPAHFPTRITPSIVRDQFVALEGDTLEDALNALFVNLFAGQAAVFPDQETRTIHVDAKYWRTPDRTDALDNPFAQKSPLPLVPSHEFDIGDKKQTETAIYPFVQDLAAQMKSQAAALGITLHDTDYWFIDVVVYGDGPSKDKPLLTIANHYFKVQP